MRHCIIGRKIDEANRKMVYANVALDCTWRIAFRVLNARAWQTTSHYSTQSESIARLQDCRVMLHARRLCVCACLESMAKPHDTRLFGG